MSNQQPEITGDDDAPHSAARFTRVPATGLAQSHPSPEVAHEFPQFLWQGHRLIKIGQELTKGLSSRHYETLHITFPPLYHSPEYKRLPRPNFFRGRVCLFTCIA